MILAVDPGNVKSGVVLWDPKTWELKYHGKIDNEQFKNVDLFNIIIDNPKLELIVEYPYPRGQMMTWQLVDTVQFIGRIMEKAESMDVKFKKFDRKDVKMALCHTIYKVTDSNVRQAVMSLYEANVPSKLGGGSCPVKGTKKQPGPLYGVSADTWQALALAIAYNINKNI